MHSSASEAMTASSFALTMKMGMVSSGFEMSPSFDFWFWALLRLSPRKFRFWMSCCRMCRAFSPMPPVKTKASIPPMSAMSPPVCWVRDETSFLSAKAA